MTAGVYADLKSLVRLKHQGQGFSFLPRQPIHSLLSGQKASRLRGRGLNFEEIRAYLPGDDIRSIDWKVTARTGKPHTRIYSEERDRPVLLIVDQRRNMFFGSRVAMKSVIAAEAAALAAWRVVSVGDRVGALVFNDNDAVEIRPHRSSKTVARIFEAIIQKNHALKADSTSVFNPDRLNEVLARAGRLTTHDALICLISDIDGANAETKRLITRLGAHNDILVALVYDPLEAALPSLGNLVVSDGDWQVEIDSADERLRRRFAKDFEERLAAARQFLLQRDVPILPLHTGRPVGEQVRDLLGALPRRRRR